ncbi:MAG: OsmC family protein [Candidatus Asgardarchaeia archaeon]
MRKASGEPRKLCNSSTIQKFWLWWKPPRGRRSLTRKFSIGGEVMAKLATFKVTVKRISGFHNKIKVKDFEIDEDEPESLGGTNKGPNPVELLLGALGSCLSTITTIYAKKRGIKVDDVEVELSGQLDPRGFQGLADVRPGLQKIEVKVKIKSPESREKLQELLDDVVKHCPVEDNLAHGVPIEVELV